MRLLVIRHGESEADLLDVHEGRANFNLTPKGHIQAESMSVWVKSHYTIDRIYCSPLRRAYQTAIHLSEALKLPLNVDDMLMEFNNGLIAGLARDVANKRYPFIENLPVHASVYEQESKLKFRYRADFMLSKFISDNNKNDTIAVISHGGMINQMFHSFVNAPLDCNIHYSTGDTGIHEWIIDNSVKRIVFSNRCNHTL